ncbi:MAG: nucleoside transporter C-terminal domain-containing protein [Bacteroidota bacterium]
MIYILRGAFGIVVLIGLAYALSTDRKNISWRLVGVGLLLQFLFAGLILGTELGRVTFDAIGAGFVRLLRFTYDGSAFVLGPLGAEPGPDNPLFTFAFGILPIIIFFASLTALLYHLGALQLLVKGLGWLMAKTLGISGAEALSAAGNVFIGQTEAPLVVKPYINGMTNSELMTLMTGGMATIAGSVLAAYVSFLGGDDPAQQAVFAGHLLSASIMSAPASIVMAKVLVPEAGKPETLGVVEVAHEKTEANAIEAAAAGAAEGLKLALNVGAMLLAFIAIIALINWLLGAFGAVTGLNGVVENMSGGRFDGFSLQAIFGYLFAPLAWAMGIETADLLDFGRLLGEKIAINEFVAYASLGELRELAAVSERTLIIGAYALCGFANFSSIAIQIGGIGGLAPDRRSDIARLGLRAVIGGALASWMTATIAGALIG